MIKKGFLLAVCLLMVGLMTACTFTVEVTPEDITTVGNLFREYFLCDNCSDYEDPYACPGYGSGCGNGTCPRCGYNEGDEGMAYREEEPVYPETPVAIPDEPGEPADPVGMPNPVCERGSLDEINALAGTALVHPAVMGVTDESFCTITGSDCVIADYDYTLAGYRWCFRAGAVIAYDLSGVYINGMPAFGEPKEGIEFAEGEGYKLARWFTLDGQYVLSVADNGEMDGETFYGIAEEMYDLTNPAMSKKELKLFYAAMAGDWQEEIAQRASMTVTAEGGDFVRIVVQWPNSYAETVRWAMNARLAEDGLLCYSDCCKSVITYTDEENFTETVVYENGSGFLSLSPEDGKIYWNGAADPECVDAVFARVPAVAVSPLVGYWYDMFSERAMMTVTAIPGSTDLQVQVNWASSAFEDTEWTMTATFDPETRRLSYSDCTKTEIVLQDGEAEEITTVVYTNGTGYFSLVEEDILAWDGAEEPDCRNCMFGLAVG